MVVEVTRTDDGSDTLFCRDLNQHYHSTFGAVQESMHIFIESGFLHTIRKFHPDPGNYRPFMKIIEIGFGTGLNALLTQAEVEKHGIRVLYTALEAFPLEEKSWGLLNYPHLFGSVDYTRVFDNLHHAAWNETVEISPFFTLQKIHGSLETFHPTGQNHLVYFDAFGPDAQPELWTEKIFRDLFLGMSTGGILVTYSVKGNVVRALKSAGFLVEKLPGPPGKRHILRAVKN